MYCSSAVGLFYQIFMDASSPGGEMVFCQIIYQLLFFLPNLYQCMPWMDRKDGLRSAPTQSRGWPARRVGPARVVETAPQYPHCDPHSHFHSIHSDSGRVVDIVSATLATHPLPHTSFSFSFQSTVRHRFCCVLVVFRGLHSFIFVLDFP